MTILRELAEDHKSTQTNAIKEFLLELDKNIKDELKENDGERKANQSGNE